MRIKRDIINKLKEWKDAEKRKPILLKGARQIGKTWAMEEFGREHFDYTAKLILTVRKNYNQPSPYQIL